MQSALLSGAKLIKSAGFEIVAKHQKVLVSITARWFVWQR